MFSLKQNVSLKPYNTFGIDVKANFFADIYSVDDLMKLFTNSAIEGKKLLMVGGGSNMLFTKDFEGVVVKMSIPGISYHTQGDEITLSAGGAGVSCFDTPSMGAAITGGVEET